MELGPSLTIEWELSDPPVGPVGWQRLEASGGTDGDRALEDALRWPSGTIAALGEGFGKKLGRATGWEGEAAVAAAARVFRRGVAFRESGASPFAAKQRRGSYRVDMAGPNVRIPAPANDSFVILDGNVAKAWAGKLPFNAHLTLTLDEHGKTLAAVAEILRAAPNGKPWTVVGGGILSDVAAFAAGLAGAAIEFIPTTLLAMADACVGGKTGVNFPPYGKNQLGLFHFPSRVRIWPGWLSTLPHRELRAGGAECLKHAILAGDPRLAHRLADALENNDLDILAPALPEVVRFKADVVREDPGETGRRAILNFGHTLGHALEALSQERTEGAATLLHGEAVAIGMGFALTLSRRVAALPGDAAEALTGLLKRAGSLVTIEELQDGLGTDDLEDPELMTELKRYIQQDKKNLKAGSTTQWILLDAPGQIARESTKSWTIGVFEAELGPAWTAFLRLMAE